MTETQSQPAQIVFDALTEVYNAYHAAKYPHDAAPPIVAFQFFAEGSQVSIQDVFMKMTREQMQRRPGDWTVVRIVQKAASLKLKVPEAGVYMRKVDGNAQNVWIYLGENVPAAVALFESLKAELTV
jgi:hypothetical protein